MKIFVTGASGFIGSAVIRELIDAGHQVTGLARSAESSKVIRDAGGGTSPGRGTTFSSRCREIIKRSIV